MEAASRIGKPNNPFPTGPLKGTRNWHIVEAQYCLLVRFEALKSTHSGHIVRSANRFFFCSFRTDFDADIRKYIENVHNALSILI